MKNTLVYILFTVITALVSSCQKTYSCSVECVLCTKTNEDDFRICKEDYDSQTAYGLAIDIYETEDYDCSFTTQKTVKVTSKKQRDDLEAAEYNCLIAE